MFCSSSWPPLPSADKLPAAGGPPVEPPLRPVAVTSAPALTRRVRALRFPRLGTVAPSMERPVPEPVRSVSACRGSVSSSAASGLRRPAPLTHSACAGRR